MTQYSNPDKALLGDFVDGSKFDISTVVSYDPIMVGKALMSAYLGFVVPLDSPEGLVKEYDNNTNFIAGRPVVGVAFRDRNLVANENGEVIYPANRAISMMTKGRIYVNVKNGVSVYEDELASVDVNGEFTNAPNEVIVGKWAGSGVGGTDLVALDLDV